MEWFKHKTASHDDPDIADCMDEYGDAGYTVFFMICEIYGQEYNHLKDGWMDVSQTFLRRKLRKSWKKVEEILNFYQEKPKESRILYKINSDRIEIKIPNFIDLASNWVKRNNPKPTEVPTEAPTAIEVEEEVEKEKNKRKETTLPNGHNKINREKLKDIIRDKANGRGWTKLCHEINVYLGTRYNNFTDMLENADNETLQKVEEYLK